MAATTYNAETWSHVTRGAVRSSAAVTGRSAHPPTSPTSTSAVSSPGPVGRSRPGSAAAAVRGSFATGSVQLELEVVAAADPLQPDLLQQLGHRPHAGDLGVRFHVRPGSQLERSLVGAGMRERERLVVGAPLPRQDQ